MNKKISPLIILLWLILNIQNKAFAKNGQIIYSGSIDQYPLELVVDISLAGEVKAIANSSLNEQIILTGKWQKEGLILFEKKASLTFPKFNPEQEKIQGYWLEKGKKRKITLNKKFTIDSGAKIEWKEKELLQAVGLPDKYFRLLVNKTKAQEEPRVSGIKIIEKKTNKLLQKINLDCQFRGLENISTDDYNFDGIQDFSVFAESYAGANTTSLYFLYDRKTGKYLESGFKGISLTFDKKKKRIYETNQCCAGTKVLTSEYKVVNNKMILEKEQCQKWDEEKQTLIIGKLSDCR